MLKELAKNLTVRPMYRFLTNKKLKNTEEASRIIMIGTPNFGNLGDHAIAEAERVFVSNNFPEVNYIEISFLHYFYAKENISKFINNSDLICVHGGGFLGSLWPSAQEMVEDILQRFPNNAVILFPQTIFFDNSSESKKIYTRTRRAYESHKNVFLFVRDESSYAFAQQNYPNTNTLKVPDIVTYLDESKLRNRSDVLLCIRNDKEKVNYNSFLTSVENILVNKGVKYKYTDTNLDKRINEYSRKRELKRKFEQFRDVQLVITDRLHGMLFALITGTPCIALNNISRKVEGQYAWIEENPAFSYISMLNETEIENLSEKNLKFLIEEKLENKPVKYDNAYLKDKLLPLKKVIEEELR